VIDWAGGRHMPGAGLLLYKSCLPLADALIAIGGSSDTRKLIGLVKWFRELPPLALYARPTRPIQQVLSSRSTAARDFGRLARNLCWAFWPWRPDAARWAVKPISRFQRAKQPTGPFLALRRDPAWLNYLLDCPAAIMTALELHESDQWRGHALLSRVGAQVRIVDLSIDSDRPENWQSAVAAVLDHVLKIKDVFEIVAASSIPLIGAAFEACGFRLRGTSPVSISDPQEKIPIEATIEINLSIGDAFYLTNPSQPFWT
jgi:hypothetical protein